MNKNKVFLKALNGLEREEYSCHALRSATRGDCSLEVFKPTLEKYRGMFGFDNICDPVDHFLLAIINHCRKEEIEEYDFRVLLLGFARAAWDDMEED